jgi:hypothetical protein
MTQPSKAQKASDKKAETHVTPEQLVLLAWNGIVNKMLQAKEEWDAVSRLLSRVPVERLPLDLQKHLSRFSRAMKFEVFIDLFTGYARGSGGIEALLVDQQFKLFDNPIEEEQDNA